MNNDPTLHSLAFITQASWTDFQNFKELHATSLTQSGFNVDIADLHTIPEFGHIDPEKLDALSLGHNEKRPKKLMDFILGITPDQFRWVQDAKAAQWHATSWSSDASHLFMQSESLGISGTASYAIVAAVMTMQGFQVPGNLQTRLAGAKQNAEQIRNNLRQADKRRAEELKRKEAEQ